MIGIPPPLLTTGFTDLVNVEGLVEGGDVQGGGLTYVRDTEGVTDAVLLGTDQAVAFDGEAFGDRNSLFGAGVNKSAVGRT